MAFIYTLQKENNCTFTFIKKKNKAKYCTATCPVSEIVSHKFWFDLGETQINFI